MGSLADRYLSMVPVSIDFPQQERPLLLFLGAHSDDIEIGALATILQLKNSYPKANVVWAVFGANGERAEEARTSAEHCCSGFAAANIIVHSFRDGYFPADMASIKESFESIKQIGSPDLILTHYMADAHQDHRTISELTAQSFRNSLILEYEIPKYDGDLGRPNVFNMVSKETVDEKIRVLETHFGSQKHRPWFDGAVFAALMRLRGVECKSGSGFAEAFYSRKLVISI